MVGTSVIMSQPTDLVGASVRVGPIFGVGAAVGSSDLLFVSLPFLA